MLVARASKTRGNVKLLRELWNALVTQCRRDHKRTTREPAISVPLNPLAHLVVWRSNGCQNSYSVRASEVLRYRVP